MNTTANTERLPVSCFGTGAIPPPERFQLWRESIGILFDIQRDAHRQRDYAFWLLDLRKG